MTDDRDPFAPIDGSDLTDPVTVPMTDIDEPIVLTPVPENVERIGEAATRLMGRAPDNFWRYHDANRELLFAVVRWDTHQGKTFRPMCWVRRKDGRQEWSFRSHPALRPLYRLDLLMCSPTVPVVIVEGEKCADAAAAVFPDVIVTTSSGGALAADKTDWTPLAHRPEILIWPDADAAGKVYAERVALIAHKPGVRKIRIVDPAALVAHKGDGNSQELPAGWDVSDALAEGSMPEELRQATEAVAALWGPPTRQTEWSEGFEMAKEGLVNLSSKDGEPKSHRFTGPFNIIGEGRDSVGAGRGLWLAWEDRDRRAQRGFVRHADLVGDGVDWLKELTDRGFPGPIERTKIMWLRQALHGCRPAGRITMVRRTGWVGNAFVLPHKTIGQPEHETILFDGRTDIARYGERGTLDDWRQYVAALAAGNSRLIFSLSLGFAGPIADLLEEESFGFNLTGPSSIGKSTGLLTAGSIWGGGGPLGFAYSWRLTDNGAEGIACAHTGTLLPLDELGQLNPEVATALTYMLGNGLGKSRAGRGGEAKRIAEWRIVLLSTGEVGIATKIEETGRGHKAKAGSLVRLIDVPADSGSGCGLFDDCHGESAAQFSQRLKSAALSNYGSAGPAFAASLAEMLLRNPETKAALRQRIDLTQKKLLHGIDADGQVTRIARHFALVIVAGDMAQVALDLPWKEAEPTSAGRICFKAWLSQRGGCEPQEILTAISSLRDAIERHGQSRFQRLTGLDDQAFPSDQSHPIRDLLGYRFEQQGEAVWGFTSAGLKEVLRGCGDFNSLVARLVDLGLIRPGHDRIQIGKKVGREKRWLYYVPDAAVCKGSQ